MTKKRWLVALLVLAIVSAASYALITYVRRARSVADVVRIYGVAARARLQPHFRRVSSPRAAAAGRSCGRATIRSPRGSIGSDC